MLTRWNPFYRTDQFVPLEKNPVGQDGVFTFHNLNGTKTMIADKSGQTKESLLREFDEVFGSLILTAKKPTAIREKDEGIEGILKEGVEVGGNSAVILLPSELKISAVLTALGRPLGERYRGGPRKLDRSDR